MIYRRRTTDDADRKVVALVRDAGEVNARLLRITLDLGASEASRLLADLVRRGWLVKTSKAQRGRSVTYGPGPSFPGGSKKDGRGRKLPPITGRGQLPFE